MYELIVKNIVNESRKVNKKSVSEEKVLQVKRSAKQLLKSELDIVNEVHQQPVVVPTEKKPGKTPIVQSVNNSRFPTKRISFDNDVTWL